MRAFFKRFRAALLGVVLLPCHAHALNVEGAGLGEHNHSSASTGGGTLALSGDLTSTKACASGYSRIGPNYCYLGGTAGSALGRDTCTNIAKPTGAKAVMLHVDAIVGSANAIAGRYVQLAAYDSNTCASIASIIRIDAAEQVAVVAGTMLARHVWQFEMPTSAALPSLIFSDDTGNQGQVSYRVIGYWD